MEILQLNVQRNVGVFDELKSRFDVLLLQEPYINQGRVPRFPGYVPFHMEPYPKAVVYVRFELKTQALNAVSNSMLAAVRVEGTMYRCLLVPSGYFRGVKGIPLRKISLASLGSVAWFMVIS